MHLRVVELTTSSKNLERQNNCAGDVS